jgi:hypothetical protein
MQQACLARMFHELLSRDRGEFCATGQPQGVGSEAYLNCTSQGPTPEDARKDGHIRGRSRPFMKHPGWHGAWGQGHKAQGTRKLRDGARRRREEEVAKRPWSVVRCKGRIEHGE